MLLLLVHTTPLFLFADLHPLIQWSVTTCKTLVCVCIAHCAIMQRMRELWIAGWGRVCCANTIFHTCAPTTIVCVSVFHGCVHVCECVYVLNDATYLGIMNCRLRKGVCYANTICRTQTGTQAVAMCCISRITQHKYRDTKKNTNDRRNCHVL